MSPELSERSLVDLIRAVVHSVHDQTQAGVRIPRVLSGAVEDTDANLAVAWIRMDQEASSSDPALSNNWGSPGVIPTTRVGDAFIGEQVRVSFDGKAGATANRTSVSAKIVLPYGVESGQRLEIDGELGTFTFYDDNDQVAGLINANGYRLRDLNNILRVQLSATEGLTIREPTSGVSGVLLNHDGLVAIDPLTGDRISITSGTTSAVPTPHWTGEPVDVGEVISSGSHVTPAVTVFGTDDIDIRFVFASALADLGAQTYTPPTNYTERTDMIGSGSGMTLASSCATRDPAIAAPGAATFVNTSAGWTRRNGHSVIVQGGGGVSPSFRSSAAMAVVTTSDSRFTITANAPSGAAAGDIILASVGIASSQIPVGWVAPNGFKQLGVRVAGLGTTHILASGVWYKPWVAGDPASYDIPVEMAGPGLTKVQATTVAIQNAYAFPGGLDIRRNNRSMPRGQVGYVESTTDSAVWTSAQLPQDLETINDIPVFSGRKYRINYHVPIHEIQSVGDSIVEFGIEISINNAPMIQYQTIHMRQTTGFWRSPITVTRTYTPSANESLDVRAQVRHNAGGGTNYNVQVFGASNVYRRVLEVTDEGAVF